jgi:hypothetical protein
MELSSMCLHDNERVTVLEHHFPAGLCAMPVRVALVIKSGVEELQDYSFSLFLNWAIHASG